MAAPSVLLCLHRHRCRVDRRHPFRHSERWDGAHERGARPVGRRHDGPVEQSFHAGGARNARTRAARRPNHGAIRGHRDRHHGEDGGRRHARDQDDRAAGRAGGVSLPRNADAAGRNVLARLAPQRRRPDPARAADPAERRRRRRHLDWGTAVRGPRRHRQRTGPKPRSVHAGPARVHRPCRSAIHRAPDLRQRCRLRDAPQGPGRGARPADRRSRGRLRQRVCWHPLVSSATGSDGRESDTNRKLFEPRRSGCAPSRRHRRVECHPGVHPAEDPQHCDPEVRRRVPLVRSWRSI